MGAEQRIAAVDIGTNSVRLLIGETSAAGGQRTLDRRVRISRLGQGVDARGQLEGEAIERTVAVLQDYAGRWRRAEVRAVGITATSAVRDAANARVFLDRVTEVTGETPRVLSGGEEAALAFAGATADATAAAPYAVLDIGGGSTEVIRGQRSAEAWTSRQLGSVRLTERFLGGDPPTAAQVAAASSFADRELDHVERIVEPRRAATLIGTAGTVTTLAALHLDLPAYLPDRIHGTVMRVDDVRAQTDRLAGMTIRQRAGLGGMAPGRAEVIVGGAIILARVMERFGFDEIVTSEADLLDGLARSLLDR